MDKVNKNMIFSERIKPLRKNTKISQKDFAEMIGVTASTFAGYENYGNYPEVTTLIKIADQLNVSIDYLLGRDNFYHNTYDFRTNNIKEITDALAFGEFNPFYIRVKNPKKPSNQFKYYLPIDRNLEIFDPFEEREKSKDIRIYLKFVNAGQHKDNIELSIYDFLCQYGFLGENSDSFDNALIKALTIDKPFYFPNFILEKHNLLLDMFENNLRNYKHPKLEKKYGYYENADTINHCYLRDFERTIGAFEMLTYYPDRIVTNGVDFYNREQQIKWINLCMLPGIKTYHNVDKGEIVPSFGYQSLISLMYLEFLFDVKNNTIPRRCSKCGLYSLPETTAENNDFICSNCLD